MELIRLKYNYRYKQYILICHDGLFTILYKLYFAHLIVSYLIVCVIQVFFYTYYVITLEAFLISSLHYCEEIKNYKVSVCMYMCQKIS